MAMDKPFILSYLVGSLAYYSPTKDKENNYFVLFIGVALAQWLTYYCLCIYVIGKSIGGSLIFTLDFQIFNFYYTKCIM